MAVKSTKNSGIARIYRANVHSHAVFFATRQAKLDNPDRDLTEIVKTVLLNFHIEMTVDAAVRDYNRLLNAFLENGGI